MSYTFNTNPDIGSGSGILKTNRKREIEIYKQR